ncbi:MAG: hypothetical protein WBV06_13810 [Acidimicrobiia bacterium]
MKATTQNATTQNATTQNATTRVLMDIEQLLDEAGFDFTVVDRCPDPACEVCTGHEVSVAA